MLGTQLERVNQSKREKGEESFEFDDADILLSEDKLKSKYGKDYQAYVRSLEELRRTFGEEVRTVNVNFFDSTAGRLKLGPKSDYLIRVFKHDRSAIRTFEERIMDYAERPDFQEYLEAKGADAESMRPEQLKNFIFEWLQSTYKKERTAQIIEQIDAEAGPEPAEAVRHEEFETSFTAKYARRWGVERIALDSVQNHLPSDAGGGRINIEFLVHNI